MQYARAQGEAHLRSISVESFTLYSHRCDISRLTVKANSARPSKGEFAANKGSMNSPPFQGRCLIFMREVGVALHHV